MYSYIQGSDMKKKSDLERISLVVRKSQHEEVISRGLNFSGLVRDLLDDHLSAHKITLSLSEATMQMYREIVSNTGATDADIEPYLRRALSQMLKDRIKQMEKLSRKLDAKI